MSHPAHRDRSGLLVFVAFLLMLAMGAPIAIPVIYRLFV